MRRPDRVRRRAAARRRRAWRSSREPSPAIPDHSWIVTVSMMPMIPASTGAPFRPRVSAAARPSSTTSTFSSTPAPTPSTASSALPRGVSSRLSGCTSISLAPSNFLFFCVDTTVPITLAICILNSLPEVPVIDDADDAGVDRRFGRVERKARFLAADVEHFFADTGADRVDGDEGAAGRLPLGRERLHQQQLDPGELGILHAHHDVADHAGEVHVLLVDVDAVDDADDGGVDGAVLEAGGHSRRAAADNQHGFADTGVDRVDGDEMIAVGLAARVDGTNHEQLAADQAGVLPGSHDRADDFP